MKVNDYGTITNLNFKDNGVNLAARRARGSAGRRLVLARPGSRPRRQRPHTLPAITRVPAPTSARSRAATRA